MRRRYCGERTEKEISKAEGDEFSHSQYTTYNSLSIKMVQGAAKKIAAEPKRYVVVPGTLQASKALTDCTEQASLPAQGAVPV